MSWEWSHTNEAYQKAEENLNKKGVKWLAECYAEWKCEDIEQAEKAFDTALENIEDDNGNTVYHDVSIPAELSTSPFLDGRYEAFVKEARKTMARAGKEAITNDIWERANELRTCENGGYSPWMCPSGCHTVEW